MCGPSGGSGRRLGGRRTCHSTGLSNLALGLRSEVHPHDGFLAEGLTAAACPASREAHCRELIALLRSNQARVLDMS